jgi:hypothetical protein
VVARCVFGRQFGWLWAAYTVRTFGTWIAFYAFALIAIFAARRAERVVGFAAAELAVGGGRGAARTVGGEFRSQAAHDDGCGGPDLVRCGERGYRDKERILKHRLELEFRRRRLQPLQAHVIVPRDGASRIFVTKRSK